MTQLTPPHPLLDEPDPPAPPHPRDGAPSDATRYLCAGAYLDDTFRDRSLREVYYQPKRFIAPSHGFDLVPVLESCLRARRLAIGRDATIVLTLAAATYLHWLSAAVAVAVLVCLRVTGAALRLARDFVTRARTGTAVDTTRSARRGLLLLLGWAAAVIVLIFLAGRTVSLVASSAAGAPRAGAGGALLLTLTAFLLPSAYALGRQKRIEDFTVDGTPPPVRWTRRMRQIREQEHGNTVIYSNYEPFIGSGDVISSWSFAQRLVRKQPASPAPGTRHRSEGEREFPTPPFTAEQIVGYVREHLQTLTEDAPPELTIPNLSVQDRVFQSARETGQRTLWTDAPELARIIRHPTDPQRHYLACRGISWGGDVVTTVHVHLAVQGKSLYLEVTSTTLAPCNERYRIVDMDGGTGVRAWIRALVTGIRETPATIMRAPGRLTRAAADTAGHHTGAGRPRSARRRKDYGARTSVRQLGTRDRLRNFTQRQDIIKFRRLIESRVYAHVLDFLDEHNVDTTEVRAQRATYLSIGMYVEGDVNAHRDVIGQNLTNPQPSDQS